MTPPWGTIGSGGHVLPAGTVQEGGGGGGKGERKETRSSLCNSIAYRSHLFSSKTKQD